MRIPEGLHIKSPSTESTLVLQTGLEGNFLGLTHAKEKNGNEHTSQMLICKPLSSICTLVTVEHVQTAVEHVHASLEHVYTYSRACHVHTTNHACGQ